MSKKSVQQEVRKRDRFMCQLCGKRGEQYAHIKPDADGGEYNLNNLIFLCYEHHQQLESARSGDITKKKLEFIGERLRDRPKIDNFLRYMFAWPAGKEICVVLGGGIKIIGQERILERRDDTEQPYLRLSVNELGTLDINAHFEDVNGKVFLKIDNNNLEVHTSDALDIVINRRSIRFEHVDKNVILHIRQSKNLDIHITGSLYLNGGHYLIDEHKLLEVESNSVVENCIIGYSMRGLLVFPGGLAM